jgi:hypothetical protein
VTKPTVVDNCALCGIVKPVICRGLCNACYQRAKRQGILDQFLRKVLTFEESVTLARQSETDEGCWPWPVVSSVTGYAGVVHWNGGSSKAYKRVWEMTNGLVPDGLTLDHLCHSRSLSCKGGPSCSHRRCVRPSHLAAVTSLEQTARSVTMQSATCKNGHEWTDANTGWAKHPTVRRHDGMARYCRQCHADRAYCRYWSNKVKADR